VGSGLLHRRNRFARDIAPLFLRPGIGIVEDLAGLQPMRGVNSGCCQQYRSEIAVGGETGHLGSVTFTILVPVVGAPSGQIHVETIRRDHGREEGMTMIGTGIEQTNRGCIGWWWQ